MLLSLRGGSFAAPDLRALASKKPALLQRGRVSSNPSPTSPHSKQPISPGLLRLTESFLDLPGAEKSLGFVGWGAPHPPRRPRSSVGGERHTAVNHPKELGNPVLFLKRLAYEPTIARIARIVHGPSPLSFVNICLTWTYIPCGKHSTVFVTPTILCLS